MTDGGAGNSDSVDPAAEPDHPVFDEAFIAGGVKESSLRRLNAPPPRRSSQPSQPSQPRESKARRLDSATERALNPQPGPRDWSPTPTRRPRRPLRWRWVLLVTVSVAATLVTVFVHGGDGSGAPLLIGQPKFTPAHSPITAPSNDPKNTSTSGPAVSGLTSAMPVGTCFNLTGNDVHSTACTTSHEYQLVAIEAASGVDSHYPSETYWQGSVFARCSADLVAYTGKPTSRWPRTLEASEFKPRPDGWSRGDRVIYCVAEWSPPSRTSAAHTTSR